MTKVLWFLLLLINFDTSIEKDSSGNNDIALGNADVAFVVLSQKNSHHVSRAQAFRQHILDQSSQVKGGSPEVHLTHEAWSPDGAWTLFALIPHLSELNTKSWILLCEEESRVKVDNLLIALAKHDHSQAIFLGKGLRDARITIIHHFSSLPPEFSYPDLAACVAFSQTFLQLFNERITEEGLQFLNFNIDPKHEIAKFLWQDGNGIALTNSEAFCTIPVKESCATFYPDSIPQCSHRDPVQDADLFIAVKTCEKFHTERIPIIKKLWTDGLQNIEYYSETEDKAIPTIDIGVPNTEKGHCGKTYAIMQRAVRESYIRDRSWLVIVDDDTLMNVARLRQLLRCYDQTEAVALGERYGYRSHKPRGYNYITGGGGMVFSMETVRRIMKCDQCRCGDDSQPDDMMIGMWLQRLGIPVTHSPLFHQARVDDYAKDYLQHQTAISFHKFWNNDPEKDYKAYLQDFTHDEL